MLCLGLDALFTGGVCALILLFAHPLLGIFNRDPRVIATGTVRLHYILAAYSFGLLQEVFSGCLRGCGHSLAPALCAVVGIVGTRIVWIATVFRARPSFATVMQVYPLSLGLTAAAIVLVWFILRRRDRLAA